MISKSTASGNGDVVNKRSWLQIGLVVTLLIPILSFGQVESERHETINEIITTYSNSTIENEIESMIEIKGNLSATQLTNMFNINFECGTFSTADSFYVYEFKEGSIDKHRIRYQNSVTYTGGGNYSVSADYSDVSDSKSSFMIPLNLTSHDLTTYDYIKLISDDGQPSRFLTYRDGYRVLSWLEFDDLSNDSYSLILSTSQKADLLSAPNETIYLSFNDLSGVDYNETDTAWSFNLAGGVIEDIDIIISDIDISSWSEMTVIFDDELYVFFMFIANITAIGFWAFSFKMKNPQISYKEFRYYRRK